MVYRICEYVQRVFRQDIVKMWPTFVQDDDGKIWLFEVKNLVVKKHPPSDEEKRRQVAQTMDKDTRQSMVSQLNEY